MPTSERRDEGDNQDDSQDGTGGGGPSENGAEGGEAEESATKPRFTLHKPDGEPVRPGRNLPLAVITGVLLGALVLFSLFTVPATFVVLLSAALLLALRELSRAFAGQGVRLALVPIFVGGVLMLVAAYAGGPWWLCGALVVTVISAMAWRLVGGASGYVRDAAASMFTIVYLPLLLGTWLLMLSAEDDGRSRLITFIIVTISSDIGGYFAGIFTGRHKMAPSISPNKTWEGFAGSLVACATAGALSVHYLLDGEVWAGVVLGVAVCVAAILGDLIESLIKRDTGVKDMGSFLPGHGGILDRLDSLLVAGPVAWVILALLV